MEKLVNNDPEQLGQLMREAGYSLEEIGLVLQLVKA